MKIKKLSRLQMLSIALGLIGIALFIGGTLRVRGVGVSHAQQPADVTICSAISGAKGLTFETVTKSYTEQAGISTRTAHLSLAMNLITLVNASHLSRQQPKNQNQQRPLR